MAPGGRKIDVRLALAEIQLAPPYRILLSADFARNDDLSRLFQSLPSDRCAYHGKKKLWLLDLGLYESLIARLHSSEYCQLADVPAAGDIPRWLLKGLEWYSRHLDKFPERRSPAPVPLNLTPYLKEKLLPFQVEGVGFIVRNGGRGMIADEMGCGKTVQAIATAVHYRQHWPVLVICPSNLVDQWHQQLLEYAGEAALHEAGDASSAHRYAGSDLLRPSDVKRIKKGSDLPGACKVCVCPYTLLDTMTEQRRITPQAYGVIIADESHNIKVCHFMLILACR